MPGLLHQLVGEGCAGVRLDLRFSKRSNVGEIKWVKKSNGSNLFVQVDVAGVRKRWGAEKVCNTVVFRNKDLHCMKTRFSLTKSLKLVRLLD